MLYFLIAFAIVVFDQLFKKWIVANIALYGEIAFIPGLVHLTYVRNTGAAFSFLKENPMFLTVFTIALAVILIIFVTKAHLSKWEKISLWAVIGGAIGNIIDRLTLGYVVDMFEVEFMNFAVFNVADCFIVCGGILFCILYAIDGINEEKSKNVRNMNDSED